MASYHFEINSGKKGSVLEHARYITRQGKFSSYADLVDSGYGNLPSWAGDDPIEFWRAAEKYERENGCVFREYEIAFPIELDREQYRELARRTVKRVVGVKPYLYAIHEPVGKLGGVSNPHMHLMFSDRLPDGINRTPQQTFARYNPQHPERGGCKKDSGGKNRMELRDAARAQRRLIADIQNEMLVEVGAETRVDHRSYQERGVEREPERHLGAARIKGMTHAEKGRYLAARQKAQDRHVEVANG
jgi:hypothetical protein